MKDRSSGRQRSRRLPLTHSRSHSCLQALPALAEAGKPGAAAPAPDSKEDKEATAAGEMEDLRAVLARTKAAQAKYAAFTQEQVGCVGRWVGGWGLK